MFIASWINFQKTDTDRESFWMPACYQTDAGPAEYK